jgi:hypothetical protein
MGGKPVKMVVGCSILVEVSVHGGKLTTAGSSWGEKVITPNSYLYLCIFFQWNLTALSVDYICVF